MVAYSSSAGAKLSLPVPVSLSEAKTLLGAESSSEASSEQSVHSDKVARRFETRRVCKHRHRGDRFPRNSFAKSDCLEMAVPGARPLRFCVFVGGGLGD